MNALEHLMKQRLEQRGWTVLSRGWPDFLCVRGKEVKAVEIKSPDDRLRQEQVTMHAALALAGIATEIGPYRVCEERKTDDDMTVIHVSFLKSTIARIRTLAYANRRSINAQTALLIEQAFAKENPNG